MTDEWKPKAWIAIVLGILIQPFVFLYLSRPKLFWQYLFLLVVVSALDFYVDGYYSLIFVVICPIHAFRVAKSFCLTGRRAWYSKWWGIPAAYTIFLVPIFLVRTFLYEPFNIPNSSMSPTLNVGDHILVDKFGFGTYGTYGITLFDTEVSNLDSMKRGKMYVFCPPHLDSKYVKRLIAIPGDTVEIEEGEISVNGILIDTKFKYESEYGKVYEEKVGGDSYLIQHRTKRPPLNNIKLEVPERSYFFLGDNRDRSSDSRVWGFVDSSNIIGEVVHVFH